MPTCTVQTHTDAFMCICVRSKTHEYATTLEYPRIYGFTPSERNLRSFRCLSRRYSDTAGSASRRVGGVKNTWQEWGSKPCPSFLRNPVRDAVQSAWGRLPAESLGLAGFTMTEMMVVVMMVSLFVLLIQMNLFGLLRRNTFRAQVQDIISTMQMATSAAAESNRRYEFIISPVEQNYILREITSPDLSEVLEEEIIVKNDLSDSCRVTYIEFDDGESINDGWAKFRVGHSGWQYGGKIVLLDDKEQPYSVVVNRLNRTVSLIKGDVGLLEPKAKEEVPF